MYKCSVSTRAQTFLVFLFVSSSVFAQEEWTKEDSIRLSKMLNSEISIPINDAFKKELEKSLTGSAMRGGKSKYLQDFILGIKPKNDLPDYYIQIKPNIRFQIKTLSDGLFVKRSESMKIGKFKINSLIDIESPFIDIKRNTNLSIPLNKKFNLNIYGNYTLDKRRSVLLPTTPSPYVIGAGFSYQIGKNMVLESQTNYQYNVIYKKWEWFWGLKFALTF